VSPKPIIQHLKFTGHPVQQMFARGISDRAARAVIDTGEMITEYPDEQPFPCRLLLGWFAGRPLHVVLAYDSVTETGYVVTAYEPDRDVWSEDFRTRRKP
jgi:hypothetical protein